MPLNQVLLNAYTDISILRRRWEALEPSVIFECKEGPFVPHEVEGVLKVER